MREGLATDAYELVASVTGALPEATAEQGRLAAEAEMLKARPGNWKHVPRKPAAAQPGEEASMLKDVYLREIRPYLTRDLRGGMERNAMRYYLAIRSYLEVLQLPPPGRLDQGLRKWVAYTERWPLQLAEEPGYVDVKRRDIDRMLRGS